MRARVCLALAAGIGFAIGLSVTAQAKGINLQTEHVPNQLIVKFKTGVTKANKDLLKATGAHIQYAFRSNGAVLVEYQEKGNDAELQKRAAVLLNSEEVQYVEPNQIIRINAVRTRMPNDPRFGELYGLHNEGGTGGTAGADIDAPEAWEITTGSRDVLVGVIDTGIDYTHPDIAPNYWRNPGETGIDAQGNDKSSNGIDDDNNGYIDDFRGWDFVNNDNDPMDDNSHGTHVSGTIGGAGNDGVGVVGVNWQVSLVGIKFLSGSGSGTLADAVRAIEYGTALNVTLTSNSWGGGGYSETMDAAIRAANDAGILFIAAAGNDGVDNDRSPHFPASYEMENVISVAATDHADGLAGFSCYGLTTVDVGAPGVDILSSTPNGQYAKYSGTSMATPHVAGVAALIKAAFPEATADQIKARIMDTADQVPSLAGKSVTGGRVNANNALEIDTVAPNAATNLTLTSVGQQTVQVNFDAAGDDGDVGAAKRYELRYAEQPIVSEEDWSMALRAKTAVTVEGSTVNAVITGLNFNSRGFIAVKAIDNVGNVGPISSSLPFAVTAVRAIMQNTAETMDGVVADAPWGLQSIASTNGSAFSDSPVSNYMNDINISLTLPPVAPVGDSATLVISTEYALESGYDFGYVEASTNGGTTWVQLDRITGTTSGWTQLAYDLTGKIDGTASLLIRFRLTTDSSISADGWKIDNITVMVPES
jgi:subtilisin family serine protease